MIIGYKLFRRRSDGSIGPLFINRKQRVPIGKWVKAEAYRTPGFAFRPGWHAVPTPSAPHLTTKGRVWCRVTLKGVNRFERPENHGREWLLAKQMRVDEVLDMSEMDMAQ